MQACSFMPANALTRSACPFRNQPLQVHRVKHMHIAYFTNAYLPVVSGVVRSVQSFRDALSALGHNVFIFAQEDDYEDTEPFIFRYPSLKLPLPGDIPTALPVSSFVDQLLPKLKLDVIHTHHP